MNPTRTPILLAAFLGSLTLTQAADTAPATFAVVENDLVRVVPQEQDNHLGVTLKRHAVAVGVYQKQ